MAGGYESKQIAESQKVEWEIYLTSNRNRRKENKYSRKMRAGRTVRIPHGSGLGGATRKDEKEEKERSLRHAGQKVMSNTVPNYIIVNKRYFSERLSQKLDQKRTTYTHAN
jgi:hypothetical protein